MSQKHRYRLLVSARLKPNVEDFKPTIFSAKLGSNMDILNDKLLAGPALVFKYVLWKKVRSSKQKNQNYAKYILVKSSPCFQFI